MIVVDVEGRPAPKGSRIAGKTKTGRLYTRAASQFEKPWVDEVKRQTQIVMRHHAQPEKPYSVEIDFRLPKPANGRYPFPVASDLDKLARAVVDGLVAGGALEDDRYVTALTVRKRYVEPGEPSGAVAHISPISVLAATSV